MARVGWESFSERSLPERSCTWARTSLCSLAEYSLAVSILCKSEIGVHGEMTESGQVPDNRSINIVLDSWRKNKFLCLKGKIFAKVTQIIEECTNQVGT